MTTVTFCQEVEAGVTSEQVDERVEELKTLGGAEDAYAKTVGNRRYICAVRRVFDQPLDDRLTDPARAGADQVAHGPAATTAPAKKAKKAAGPAALTDDDYRGAAARLDCDPAAIRAVADVESGGRTGFLADGRPKILFESHVFSRLTGGRYDDSHPGLSTPTWVRNYVGGAGEYARLARAIDLDREAALKSASWGKFQILGRNYPHAGFDSIEDFVAAHERSEKEQLDAFVQFILSRDLSDELRELRWADFARRYNGPRYAENRYDEKMADAYALHSAQA